jgi:hypothetical protein
VDHSQRKAAYAKAFQIVTEYVKACISDAPKLHATVSELESISLYPFVMFAKEFIPLDVDFDHGELLGLLSELYDLYRPFLDDPSVLPPIVRETLLTSLRCVCNDMATIYNCVRSRVLKGHIGPASIDEGLFNSVVARISDYKKKIIYSSIHLLM